MTCPDEVTRAIALLGRHAEHRALPVSAGFRWRNGTKRSTNSRSQVGCSRAEEWSEAIRTGRSQAISATAVCDFQPSAAAEETSQSAVVF